MALALDRDVLEAAARWHVELACAPGDAALRSEHERWLGADPSHGAAWARIALLRERLGPLTPGIAEPTLNGARARRRATLKILGLLLMAGGAAGLGVRQPPVRGLLAELRSGVGEQRTVTLDDGTQLTLNTDSAVNVHYDSTLRRIELVQGEIAVRTAEDGQHRSFMVVTAHGTVQALGTRFIVRQEADSTRVSVQQHAVLLRPLQAPERPLRLEAGQRSSLTAQRSGPVLAALGQEDAWTRGMLIVRDWRLDAFLAELARYRHGHLRCTAAVAGLHVSGAFHLGDTDTVLRNLAATLPVRVRQFTRYWVSIEPA